MLKTNNLSVGYNKKIVVSGIDIDIQAGEIVTIIGPNGAGKSTILKTVTKQLKGLEGQVLLTGQNIMELKESQVARTMSMVMTRQPNPELMTCREVVATGRYPYTGSMGILSDKDWQIVDESLAALQAESLASMDFSRLSDGQRQRVMLARALCQEPKVLILDEPTSYLDIRYKLEILTAVHKLAKEKKIAILMSLHELQLARLISDTIVCVKNDRIDKVGSPDVIFDGDYINQLFDIDQDLILDSFKKAIDL